MAEIRLGRRRFKVPASKPMRLGLGGGLVVGGLLGFLPVLGFWMLPLGLVVLSVDSPALRRFRRRSEVWWGRRRPFARRNGAPERDGGGRRGKV